MYAYVLKFWEFLQKNARNVFIFGGFVLILLCIYWLLCGKYVSDNREPVDQIRTELDQATDTKQDIADTATAIQDTVGELQDSIGKAETAIDTATGASQRFDQILGECQDIIEQIRNQPAK